jgi:hypothetical protein
MILHGGRDRTVPPSNATNKNPPGMYELLIDAGTLVEKYIEPQGGHNHDTWERMYRSPKVRAWLLVQRRLTTIHQRRLEMLQQTSWRYCNKCKGLVWQGAVGTLPCAAGGLHTDDGSGTYTVLYQTNPVPGQDQWFWCNKCGALHFGGSDTLGQCPGGDQHSVISSSNYKLCNNDAAAPGQSNWRWCHKCQILTFAGAGSLGACQAGGQHDPSASADYKLLLT